MISNKTDGQSAKAPDSRENPFGGSLSKSKHRISGGLPTA
jgi:hypothetical protein